MGIHGIGLLKFYGAGPEVILMELFIILQGGSQI